jgi:hypothetical protein
VPPVGAGLGRGALQQPRSAGARRSCGSAKDQSRASLLLPEDEQRREIPARVDLATSWRLGARSRDVLEPVVLLQTEDVDGVVRDPARDRSFVNGWNFFASQSR